MFWVVLESGGGHQRAGPMGGGAMGVGHWEFGTPCVGAKRAFLASSKSLTCLVPHPDA